MFELTIDGEVYAFNFGFGFYREINKQKVSKKDDNGVSHNVGVKYKLAGVWDANPDDILDVLLVANKFAPAPKVSKDLLEEYIESECDIVELAGDLVDFFRVNNTTKGEMRTLDRMMNMTDEERAKLLKA